MLLCFIEVAVVYCKSTIPFPRLFRRGSRASLVSVSEEDPRNPFSPLGARSPRSAKPDFTQSLDDASSITNLYKMLATAQSPSASPPDGGGEDVRRVPSPVPVESAGGHSHAHHGQVHQRVASDDATSALNELDDFLDLLTTTDRIDNQRSPLPSNVKGKSGDVMPAGKSHPGHSVPKYYISTTAAPSLMPTDSTHQQHTKFKGEVGGVLLCNAMPTEHYAMPDLVVGGSLEEVDEYSDSGSSPDALDPPDDTGAHQYQGHPRHHHHQGYAHLSPQERDHHQHRHHQGHAYHQKSHSYDNSLHGQSHNQQWVEPSSQRAFPQGVRPASEEDIRSQSDVVLPPRDDQSGERYWQERAGHHGGSHAPHHSRDGSYGGEASELRECRVSESNMRSTSPLAMMSYTSQGSQGGSPDKVEHKYVRWHVACVHVYMYVSVCMSGHVYNVNRSLRSMQRLQCTSLLQ